jgi:hypothetical protein
MINFLQSPNQFTTIKVASLSDRQLARIACFQYRQAKTLRLASNWVTNLISSGVAKVKGMAKYVKNAFLKILKVFFVQTPVVNLFTKFFQSIAYDRLLSKLYHAWKLGVKHRESGEDLLSRVGFIKYYGSRDGLFFYDDYMSGYDETSDLKDLRIKAINIAKEDLGLRTVTEIIKVAWETLNPIKFFESFFTSIYGIGDKKVFLPGSRTEASFIDIFLYQLNFAIPTMLAISFPQIFTVKLLGGLALGSLMGYNPKDVIKGNSSSIKKLKEGISSLFSKQQKRFDEEEILEKIPEKDVFFHDAQGDLKSVARASREEIEELVKSI